jgi:hypothetical protein
MNLSDSLFFGILFSYLFFTFYNNWKKKEGDVKLEDVQSMTSLAAFLIKVKQI